MNNFNQYQYEDLLIRGDDPYARAKYEIILGYFRGRSPMRILNAGCGSGELSFLLAAMGHVVTGIDPSQEYVALAKKNCPQQLTSRCDFQVAGIENFIATAPFDCVMATDVLEHIADDRAAFKKLLGFLKPEGDIVITVPALSVLFGFHDRMLGHFRRYNKRSLRVVVASSGNVREIKMRYFDFLLIPIAFLYGKLLKKNYPLGSSGGMVARIKQAILRLFFGIEKVIPPPLGTSVIYWGKKM